MPRSNSVIAALCLLVALTMLGISYEVSHLFRSGNVVFAQQIGPSHRKTILGSAPNDSPVTVRGGSIKVANTQGDWNPGKSTTEYVESNLNSANIYLDGVALQTTSPAPPWGTALLPIANNTNSNWVITVYDRDQTGHHRGTNSFQICSAEGSTPYTGCDAPTGTIAPVSSGTTYDVYFYLDPGKFCPEKIYISGETDASNQTRQVQELHDAADDGGGKCGTGSRTLRENIYEIDVNIGGTTVNYNCVNGQCDIGIGDSAFGMPVSWRKTRKH